MNAESSGEAGGRWSRVLIFVGSLAMLVGAVDPMEGSALILPGSGLAAWGWVLGRGERRVVVFSVWAFALIAMGVGAMWGMSWLGGIGGKTGHSMGWGVLILPYLVGWWMGICGPGSARWVLIGGIVVGAWYVALPMAVVYMGSGRSGGLAAVVPLVVIGTLGLATVVGCILRLRGGVLRLAGDGQR